MSTIVINSGHHHLHTNTISLRISVITVNMEISMSIVTYREAHLMQLWTWEQGD